MKLNFGDGPYPCYIGTEFQHSFSTQKNLATIGGDLQISSRSGFKVKLDTETNIQLLFGTQISEGLNLSFCVGSNLKSSLPVVGFKISAVLS